jgi:ubiquinone/menaquinone biosynthesis C-methylase UbiE
MATIEENERVWNAGYAWSKEGDEWSKAWGGPAMQWYSTLLPRIHSFVPSALILEIACGHGRWTQYLKDLCQTLIATDISTNCVRACKKRFGECANASFYKTDGLSLPMAPDRGVDFVFSFDSLVHADFMVIDSYFDEFDRILSNDGVAFIHHSNLGAYPRLANRRRFNKLVAAMGLLDSNTHWRTADVSALKVRRACAVRGLRCIAQEVFPWGETRANIDCISVLARKSSRHSQAPHIPIVSRDFMRQARRWRQLAELYSNSMPRP